MSENDFERFANTGVNTRGQCFQLTTVLAYHLPNGL